MDGESSAVQDLKFWATVNSLYSFLSRILSNTVELVRSAVNMAHNPTIFNATAFFGKYFDAR